MKTALCSLVTLLACASACTADLALHAGPDMDVETPPAGQDAGDGASWLGPAIEGAARTMRMRPGPTGPRPFFSPGGNERAPRAPSLAGIRALIP